MSTVRFNVKDEFDFNNDKEYQQYYPDFYLPEYDIYIENFGIDENNNVAPYFKDKNGLSASEAYNESIKWKRKIHNDNNTTMIETFYYENKQGKFITNLENKLRIFYVKIEPKSEEELWEIINKNNSGLFNEMCNVFSTIICLIKSNNYSIDYVKNINEVQSSLINKLTLELITPLYLDYQKGLNENNMIDFNDMINMATAAVSTNKYIHNYKYVIVDEYQDMSISRY